MKKNTSKCVIGVLLVLSLTAVIALSAVTYGYSSSREKGQLRMHGMMAAEQEAMEGMHEEMTKGMPPELKSQADRMHEQCEQLFKGGKDSMM